MTDPTALHGLFHELKEVNPAAEISKARRLLDKITTYLLGRITFSTPPLFEFPLNFVKSRTWLTVSTSEVPQAWTVRRNEVWLSSRSVSASSSAAASIFTPISRNPRKVRSNFTHAMKGCSIIIEIRIFVISGRERADGDLPQFVRNTARTSAYQEYTLGFGTYFEINRLLDLSARIILRLRTALRMMTPSCKQTVKNN